MSFLVATPQELSLLTGSEERVYRRFRYEGKTFEEIAKELRQSADNVRKRWNNAVKKIKAHRELTENPQYFLAKGQDVLRGQRGYGQQESSARFLQTIPDMDVTAHPELTKLFEKGIKVRIRQNIKLDGEEEQELQTKGILATVDEVYEKANPSFCLVTFTNDREEMQAAIVFDMLEPA